MSQINFVRLFCILAFAFGASSLSASTITYAVGTCRPSLRSFRTISRALDAVPPANVLVVCPGTYTEQVQITRPVTLAGISHENSARAIIASPVSGLITNAMDDLGNPLAVQLWVNNASGPVNISDLTVDAAGNQVNQVPTGTFVVGIFYENSSGTVSRVATQNQQSSSFSGIGIFAQGGISNPLVTIENNSVHDYDFDGIVVEANSATPTLTAVIKDNQVSNPFPLGQTGVNLNEGANITVTNNLITNTQVGISIAVSSSLFGSVSDNTMVNDADGIFAGADTVSVTSNKILASTRGIDVETSVAAIERNTIAGSCPNCGIGSTIGIAFNCSVDRLVQSNIVMDAVTGFDSVPSLITKLIITRNGYFNVNTISTGFPGC